MVSPDTTDIGSVGAPKQVQSEPLGADCYEQKAMLGEGGQPELEREFQGLVAPAETRLAGLAAAKSRPARDHFQPVCMR